MTPRHPLTVLERLLRSESFGGLLLMCVAALALGLANSPLQESYREAMHAHWGAVSVHVVVNDGMMSLFFLLVGLELKRELLNGELRTWSARILPGLAAAGGMIAPALIYLAVQKGDPATARGWAVPAATDIAFSLGVLALLGRAVPAPLKVFLAALAIIDDLGAVIIIAVAYTAAVNLLALAGAALCLAVLITMNRMKVQRVWLYLLVGAGLWVFTFASGVHATVAGVALAFTIPLKPHPEGLGDEHSPLHRLEHALHPWIAYAVTPIFGFVNAGVNLLAVEPAALVSALPLGVGLGLAVGKPVGVFLTMRAAVGARLAALPEGVGWGHVLGLSALCGIGFTMSLFIGDLAFQAEAMKDLSKVGVIAGSAVSGLLGAGILLLARRRPA